MNPKIVFPSFAWGPAHNTRLEVTENFPAILLPSPSLSLGRTLNSKAKCFEKKKGRKGNNYEPQFFNISHFSFLPFNRDRRKHKRTNLVLGPNHFSLFLPDGWPGPQMTCPGCPMLLLESENLSAKDHIPSQWL